MIKKLSFLLCMVGLLGVSSQALAIPLQLSHQGRVLQANLEPLSGISVVTFQMYTYSEGGSAIWSETLELAFNDGFYFAILGTTQPIPDDLFDGGNLYLGVTIGTDTELLPRQAIASVPYAFRASVAERIEGEVNATTLYINGTPVIDSEGQWIGDSTGLIGPQGEPGEPGESANAEEVAQNLSTDQSFISSLSEILFTNHAEDLTGPPGESGSDTGEQILEKIYPLDGENSQLDAAFLRGLTPEEVGALGGGLQGVEQAGIIRLRATGSETPNNVDRHFIVNGEELINFSNDAGLALVVIRRSDYEVVDSVNGVGVRRNFNVNDVSRGTTQWQSLIDALDQLDFSTHIVLLASKGPINRFMNTQLGPSAPVPADVLKSLGASRNITQLTSTDAISLIGLPDLGEANGKELIVDTNLSTSPTSDLAAILADGDVVGLHSQAFRGGIMMMEDEIDCEEDLAGALRWHEQKVQVCDGLRWSTMHTTRVGSSSTNPGTSCQAILDGDPSSEDGVYWLRPHQTTVQVYCDMTTAGGGWALVGRFIGWNSSRTFVGQISRDCDDYEHTCLSPEIVSNPQDLLVIDHANQGKWAWTNTDMGAPSQALIGLFSGNNSFWGSSTGYTGWHWHNNPSGVTQAYTHHANDGWMIDPNHWNHCVANGSSNVGSECLACVRADSYCTGYESNTAVFMR